MSGTSKSRSKGAIKSKSHLDQHETSKECEKNEEKSSNTSGDVKSTEIIENVYSATATEKKYKMPYRNFLRDLKIQMQNEHLSYKELIKIASERWRQMSLEEKTPYIREAAVAKEIELKSLKKRAIALAQAAARQETVRRKRRCPNCGGYPASSSPSSSSEPSTNATTETTSGDYYHDYTSDTDSTYCSHRTSDYDSEMTYSSQQSSSTNKCDAAKKKTYRQKKKQRRNSRRVKKRKMESTSGSASYYTNSSDRTLSSDTAGCSEANETHGTSNYTSDST